MDRLDELIERCGLLQKKKKAKTDSVNKIRNVGERGVRNMGKVGLGENLKERIQSGSLGGVGVVAYGKKNGASERKTRLPELCADPLYPRFDELVRLALIGRLGGGGGGG